MVVWQHNSIFKVNVNLTKNGGGHVCGKFEMVP